MMNLYTCIENVLLSLLNLWHVIMMNEFHIVQFYNPMITNRINSAGLSDLQRGWVPCIRNTPLRLHPSHFHRPATWNST